MTQVVATKILLELAPLGALRGAIVRSYATVAEEDNDGGGPQFLVTKVLPGAGPELVPDAVILTEGTGDSAKGALGIYRGQRGRMQIEVAVTGKSCHGSMPWEGRNPLEWGAPILAEAARRYEAATVSSTTRSSATARARPRGRASTRRATARSPSGSCSGSTGASRSGRRRRRPSPTSKDSRPCRRCARRPARGHRFRPDVRRADVDRLRPPQPAGLHGLADAGGPPGRPGRRRGVSRRRVPARSRGRPPRRAPQGAARRPVDLLDGRRRVPGSEGRHVDRRPRAQALGDVGRA